MKVENLDPHQHKGAALGGSGGLSKSVGSGDM